MESLSIEQVGKAVAEIVEAALPKSLSDEAMEALYCASRLTIEIVANGDGTVTVEVPGQ